MRGDYTNPAPHFKMEVQPVDNGLLFTATIYPPGENEEREDRMKILPDKDALRAEIAKLMV